jgi:RNA polymerase sigma-70 factor (ECF subfamily)
MILLMMINDDGETVFVQIYEKYYRIMLRAARGILEGDAAEDAVQEAFVKIFEKYGREPEVLCDKPTAFFVITSRNLAIDVKRKNNRHKTISLDYVAQFEDDDIFRHTESTEETVMRTDEGDRLIALVRKLSPGLRAAFEMRYIMEYSNREIAQMLGVSESVVSTRLDRARRKLKEIIESEEGKLDGR